MLFFKNVPVASGGQPTRKRSVAAVQHQHLTFQIVTGDVQERAGFKTVAEAFGDFGGAARPMAELLGGLRLRAERFRFALAFGRHGDDKFRAFAREQRKFPNGFSVGGLLDGTGLDGISGFIHRLRGFEQQGVDGFVNGALAVRFGGQIFKRAGFPRENPAERRLAARAFGFGVNQFAVLNPQFRHERPARDAQHGRAARETFHLDDVHEAFALDAAKAAVLIAAQQGFETFE